ncbi:hypothetical protein TRAPUB_14305 [Trametes pubescens]|uniref:Uncharacterized protein n=1 Tax=Trametes pubescens TaxID=154538 RepID=A0A1M2VNV6_TRAPU|nr:hypothetical protein TRAPUB_14305 [Trametes pubescens]
MRLQYLSALAAVVACASFVGAAPVPRPGMPLPLWLAAKSTSARPPKEQANPFALPWGVDR